MQYFYISVSAADHVATDEGAHYVSRAAACDEGMRAALDILLENTTSSGNDPAVEVSIRDAIGMTISRRSVRVSVEDLAI